jgi:peptidoglycan/xylan/chitin deacetylase (PgdA/CDA1 family)
MNGNSIVRGMAKRTIQAAAATFGPHRWPSRHPRLWILMYHRILPPDDPRTEAEEPGMVVTPETFRRHLAWLRPAFELVQLGEWVQRAKQGKPLPRKACAITFDDGWRDNYEFAFPILKETGTPATIFAVSHMIGSNEMFWPNRVARLLRDPRVFADRHEASAWLLDVARLSEGKPPSRDEISRIIVTCKSFSDSDISDRLSSTEEALSLEAADDRSLMNWDELHTLVESGLVEAGSHTCHHRRLNDSLDILEATREIRESQALLQGRLGKPITLFCYPNGDYSREVHRLVRRHYQAAVTTQRGINQENTASHQLHRIGIHEDVSNHSTGFLSRLSAWL